MKLRYKILLSVFALFTVAIIAGAVLLSHESACPPVASSVKTPATMTAAFARCYGSPDIVTLEETDKPKPAANEVLIRVKAAAVNPLDWHQMRGSPYLMRIASGLSKPTDHELGVDFSGVIEAVGSGVSNFKPGDAVFGGWGGAFAEYMVMPADRAIVKKPANISFAEAAAIPIAALTALQALVNEGNLQRGQRVLINGASGGVGTYAVQIAKSMGADITGVCSTRNVEMVTKLGANQVFDYKKESYIESGQKFDLIIDLVGNHSVSDNLSVLQPRGTMVIVGGPKGNWFKPLKNALVAAIKAPFIDQKVGMFIASLDQQDLSTLAAMMQAGELSSRIDRYYPLSEIADALRYSESGRARGKIIVSIN